MTVWCAYGREELSEAEAIVVGAHEVASGPAHLIYACGACVVAYRVMRLEEHPPGTNGRPRYRDRPATPMHPRRTP